MSQQIHRCMRNYDSMNLPRELAFRTLLGEITASVCRYLTDDWCSCTLRC